MFFRGCVNIVAQSFSQLRRTKMVDVSRILSALGAPSTTRTDLQAFTSLPLLISTHYFGIVIQAHCSLSRTVWVWIIQTLVNLQFFQHVVFFSFSCQTKPLLHTEFKAGLLHHWCASLSVFTSQGHNRMGGGGPVKLAPPLRWQKR